jgi:hypothetical protein
MLDTNSREHINTPCGQNIEILNVTVGGIYTLLTVDERANYVEHTYS